MKRSCFKGCFCSKEGFTLIELLVVVLIIGILAAVAVPQYQVAVKKAQLAKYIPLVKALATAEETYYLANGTYTRNLAELDIDMPNPSECTYGTTENAGYYDCADPVARYGAFDGPTNVQAGDATIRYVYYLTDDTSVFERGKKGDIICFSKGEVARKTCQTLGPGIENEDRSTSWDYYYKLQ